MLTDFEYSTVPPTGPTCACLSLLASLLESACLAASSSALAMEQRQIEEEEELMQEALALLADCQDDDYDAAISRLLLPSDDELHSPVSANRSDPIMSTTELAHAPMPVPLNLGLPPSNATFSAEVSPSATPTLTTATSSPVKKTPMSTAKQQQRKKKAPSSTGKKRKTASHNSNRARDERKEELIYLRKTVQTMEARLRTLQLSQRRALAAPALASARIAPRGEAQTFTEGAFALAALQGHAIVSEPPRSPEDMKEDAAMGPVWTEIAARQYQERRRVELENIRLKLILEGQIKMAKSLEKMLTKRTSLRVSCNSNALGIEKDFPANNAVVGLHRKPTSTEEEDEAAIFARLEKELETALDEVDVVFEAIGLARMEKTYADAQVRRENGTTIMEIFANKVVPFSVEATSHAVWEHFVHSMDHIPSRFVYQKQLKKTETTDDTLMESFGLELVGSRNATAAFRVRQIRRKFVQPHRVVIAWPMYSEALELSAEPTKGVRLHEKCFTVVKALPNASGRRGALIQTCYVLRPEIYGHVADRERILTTLTDFLLDSVSHTISSSHQMIENYLLDGALRFQPEPIALTQVAREDSAVEEKNPVAF
ncbi:hypothetical protein GN958_ATG08645 [Phytophthora infestans]|uniref:M96 mating-specific protein family n=1 Tax=Phytophthora infestans TaxID=4787 RepID=A0A8S9URF7_PHYIN|nr:hypothetical protein GN958_ATG08645 [Phytophthora infestans]